MSHFGFFTCLRTRVDVSKDRAKDRHREQIQVTGGR